MAWMTSGSHSRAFWIVGRLAFTTAGWRSGLNAKLDTPTFERPNASRVALMLRAMYGCSLANSFGFTLKFWTPAG